MRYIKYFIIILFLLCILSACKEGDNNLNIEISSPEKNITDLVKKTYRRSQLMDIVQLEVSLQELNTKYPIECIRKIGNLYRVSYLGDFNIAMIVFDSNGNKILGNIYNTVLAKSDFHKLNVGQLLEDVQKIDPYGEYLFLYTGRNDSPRVSTHYTKDGYIIVIKYNDNDVIVSIDFNLV